MTMTNERFREVENVLCSWVEEEGESKFSRIMALEVCTDKMTELVQSVGATTPEWVKKFLYPEILQRVVKETGIPAEEIIYYLKTAPWYPWEFLDPFDFEDNNDYDWGNEE